MKLLAWLSLLVHEMHGHSSHRGIAPEPTQAARMPPDGWGIHQKQAETDHEGVHSVLLLIIVDNGTIFLRLGALLNTWLLTRLPHLSNLQEHLQEMCHACSLHLSVFSMCYIVLC